VVYETDNKLIDIVHLEPQIVLSLIQDLHSANRATFLFDEEECLLVNEEKDGPDWLNIARKYDTNVKSAIEDREEVLRKVGSGEMKVIKVTVCADPKNNVDRELASSPSTHDL
jgi:hypothetical protein